MRDAIDARRAVALEYRAADGGESRRVVRPLGLFFWGGAWTLGAWCELRSDFRNFRLDRITSIGVGKARFDDEPGRRLADYVRAMSCREP